jgi:hypothetical protein
MRTLRITLEEINLDKNICHRAERVIRYSWEVPTLLKIVFEGLEKALNEEIKKHEYTDISRLTVRTYPNPKAAPGADEAP